MFFHYINDMISCTFADSQRARIHAKRNAVVQIVVATAAFIMLMRVFPMGVVQHHTLSKQQAYDASAKGPLEGDIFTAKDKKLQMLFFSEPHVYQITLYMQCADPMEQDVREAVLFRLYDDNFSCIYEEEVNSQIIEKKGYLKATPDLDVETERAYYYEIIINEQSGAEYVLPVADRETLAQAENRVLYIDGILNENVSLIADIDYTKPLSVVQIIVLYALILIVAAIFYFFLAMLVFLYDDRLASYAALTGKYFRIGVSVLWGFAAIALFVYSVILGHFGGELWDRLFFAVGIIIAWGWVAGILWHNTRVIRPAQQSKYTVRSKMCLVWRNYIQTVCFGLLFYALCQYVNADRNFYHDTNTRWMLIFLAIALLMNYNEKQLVNKFSAIWLFLGAVGSVFYCQRAGVDENKLLVARLTCGVVVSWGLLVLNILFYMVRTKAGFGAAGIGKRIVRQVTRHRQQTVYIALWVLFSLLMYANRYEKVWVFLATLPFIALFFAPNARSAQCRFLKNFSNGIFVNFLLVVVFCLAHRPHHYWMLYRYGGIFHTVACTGMYLAVVFGTAIAKLYGKLKTRKNMFCFCLPEYFVVACVFGFILLTMSRTAFLTTAVTIIAVVALTAAAYHKNVKRILKELGVLAAVCVVSFPMTYTAVRMVPAVVNDPVRYDIEFQDRAFMIYEGDPVDSDKYMTVRRFFSALFGRFQIPEQASGREKEAGELCWWEGGALAYMGDDLAGLDLRQFSQEGGMEDDPDNDPEADISNGRFDIFRAYIKAIRFKGHPGMGPEDENGDEYAHAHNSYLQVAYNFGLIAGILFLLLCAMTLWRSIRFALDYGKQYSIVFVPFALVVVFGFISLTEWAYHPCIPAGFSFILMQTVLMRTDAQGK